MRFDELDLEDEILDGLEDMNFHEMTPVQEHTIPVILEGRDIIGCAQTGTGKTAAYTLPLLNKLLHRGQPRQCGEIADHRADARAGAADRPAVPGLLLLCAPLDDGGLRRRRRQGLGHPEERHAERRRRGDRHSGPHDRPPAEQRRRPFARRILDSRRGRPHARHGFLGRHHEDRLRTCPPSGRRSCSRRRCPRRSANWPRPFCAIPPRSTSPFRNPTRPSTSRPTSATRIRSWASSASCSPSRPTRRRSSSRRRSSRSRSWPIRSSA